MVAATTQLHLVIPKEIGVPLYDISFAPLNVHLNKEFAIWATALLYDISYCRCFSRCLIRNKLIHKNCFALVRCECK